MHRRLWSADSPLQTPTDKGIPDNGYRMNRNGHYGHESPHVASAVTSVPLSRIQAGDSPRFGGLDPEHVRCLADADAELPPILVHRGTWRIIDGSHRLGAAVLRGQETIRVQFFDGDERDAFLLAVEYNTTHGLPLRLDERRAAARRIIQSHPEMSDRSIAVVSGLCARTVANIRAAADDGAQATTRLGRDGRVRPLNSADGRRIAGAMFLTEPDSSLRRVAREAGISLGTTRDVRERIRRGEDPALPRQGRRNSAPAADGARAGARRQVEQVDQRAILRQLSRDPSLRYSEAGRALLRWLDGRAIGTTDWEGLLSAIPPHCAIVVARLARASALAWTEFAEALDEFVRDCDREPAIDPPA
jgi:ParB-like chromosome segregation protein Spo0J